MSPPGSALHDLSRAIGSLEKGIANLEKKLDQESDDAKKHRQSLRDVIAALSEAVRALTVEVTTMKPIVADYAEERAESKGRAKMMSALQAIWMAVAGVAVALITWWLNRRGGA